MAHFFFHFSDGESRARDEIGLELDTVEQAYLEAFETARSMWPELLAARCNPLDCLFEVADADGAVLFRLPFSELFDACRPPRAPQPGSELLMSIEATHTRAQAARTGIRFSFDEVRQSLQEANDLLGQLALFERSRSAYRGASLSAAAADD
jgi:hypothetical protein